MDQQYCYKHFILKKFGLKSQIKNVFYFFRTDFEVSASSIRPFYFWNIETTVRPAFIFSKGTCCSNLNSSSITGKGIHSSINEGDTTGPENCHEKLKRNKCLNCGFNKLVN